MTVYHNAGNMANHKTMSVDIEWRIQDWILNLQNGEDDN